MRSMKLTCNETVYCHLLPECLWGSSPEQERLVRVPLTSLCLLQHPEMVKVLYVLDYTAHNVSIQYSLVSE